MIWWWWWRSEVRTTTMRLFQSASDWFWNEDVWLPPGYSWDHFKNSQLTNNKTQELFKCLVTNHKKRQRCAWEGNRTGDRIFERLFRLWILINLPSFIIFFILFPSPSSSSSSDFSPLNTFSNLSQSKLVSRVGTNLVMQRTFNWNLSSTVARDSLQPDKIWPGSPNRPDYLWYRWE